MVEMISTALLAYCLIAGGVALAVVTFLHEIVGRYLKVRRDMPAELLEPTSAGWYLLNFIMEYLFIVAVPTFAYGIIVVVLPLSGIRPGLAVAVLAFSLGAVPTLLSITARIKLSMVYLMYILFGVLVKVAAVLAVIGYLYSL